MGQRPARPEKLITIAGSSIAVTYMAKQCMCPVCGAVSGLLALLAGTVMLLAGLSMLDVRTSLMVAGVALALYGVGALAHSANICPMCK
jgi:uncharacterized membrane protein